MQKQNRGRPGSFAGDVAKLVGGTTFAQALGIVFAPVMSRMYGPDAYGVLSLFLSFSALLGIVSCMRYELAIMLPEHDQEAARLLVGCLLIALGVSTLAGWVFWIGGSHFVQILNAPALEPFLWLIPPMVCLSGFRLGVSYWASRKRLFGSVSVSSASGSLAQTIFKLSLGWSGRTGGGSLIGSTLGSQALAVALLGGKIVREDGSFIRSSIREGGLLESFWRYRKFPLIDSWGAFLNNASWQIPPLALAVFFSQTVVGFYALAFRMIQLPMSFIGSSLGQVFYQRASMARGDAAELARLTGDVFQRLVAIALFPSLILGVAGPELFGLVFGARWAESGAYAQILSVWMFTWFISSPLSTLFLVKERQGYALMVHMSIFVTRLISLAIGGYYGSVFLALFLFSASGTLMYGALVAVVLHLGGVSVGRALRILGHLFKAILIPSIGLIFLRTMTASGPILLVGSIASAVLYAVIIVRGDREMKSWLSLTYRRYTKGDVHDG